MRFFDMALFHGYGLAERRLGDFLRSKQRDECVPSTKAGRLPGPRRGRRPTDSFFLSTKPFDPVHDHSYDSAMRSFKDSLQRMGPDRFDIPLFHDTVVSEHGDDQPAVFRQAIDGAPRVLSRLRDEGVVGAICIETNEWEVAEAAINALDFDTMLVAGRCTLLERCTARTLNPLCIERGARLIMGGVFNSGLLVSETSRRRCGSTSWRPRSWSSALCSSGPCASAIRSPCHRRAAVRHGPPRGRHGAGRYSQKAGGGRVRLLVGYQDSRGIVG